MTTKTSQQYIYLKKAFEITLTFEDERRPEEVRILFGIVEKDETGHYQKGEYMRTSVIKRAPKDGVVETKNNTYLYSCKLEKLSLDANVFYSFNKHLDPRIQKTYSKSIWEKDYDSL